MTMIYKNWTKICHIENSLLLMLVALTEDIEILEKLAKGFPELFTEDDTTTPYVPISLLKRQARDYSIEQGYNEEHNKEDSEFALGSVVGDVDIPLMYMWNNDDPHQENVPPGLEKQLIGQLAAAGKMVIRYEEEDYLVITISFGVEMIGKVITAEDVSNLEYLWLSSLRFFHIDV